MAISTFRAIYTLSGAPIFTKGYGIAASEAWSRGSVVAWNSAGALLEPTADNVDVLGISMEIVTAGAATGPLTSQCLVNPFNYDTVYAVKHVLDVTTAVAATDIGTTNDLDIDATNGWGIKLGTSATAATPNFRVIDIDTTRNEFHVVINPIAVAAVFQWIDAAV